MSQTDLMEQLRLHLPSPMPEITLRKMDRKEWGKRLVTANGTGIRHLLQTSRSGLYNWGKKGKKKGGGDKSFAINSGAHILLLTTTAIECWIPKSIFFLFKGWNYYHQS